MADDTLLSPTNVWLFGRKVGDLQVVPGADHNPFVPDKTEAGKTVPGPQSNNNFLENQLAKLGDNEPVFARIYGFSYAGTYYELETPALYLVHGDGAVADSGTGRANRSPDDPSRTGIAAADFRFADGLRVWAFDKGDFSIRLDVSSGPLDQILLDMEGCESSPGVAGARVSGARVSGARVSGARVSGARVSGARVSGARLSGD